MGRLLLTLEDGSRQEHPVLGTSLLGRGAESDIRVDDLSVSRTHALITCVRGVYWLTDANSTNGTFLNDEQLTAPTVLVDGDTIRLGDAALLFSESMVHALRFDYTQFDPAAQKQAPLADRMCTIETRGRMRDSLH